MSVLTLVTNTPPAPARQPRQVVRLSGLSRLLDVSKSTIHRLRRESSDFPKPFLISKQAVGFDLAEIEIWIDGRIKASRTNTKGATA